MDDKEIERMMDADENEQRKAEGRRPVRTRTKDKLHTKIDKLRKFELEDIANHSVAAAMAKLRSRKNRMMGWENTGFIKIGKMSMTFSISHNGHRCITVFGGIHPIRAELNDMHEVHAFLRKINAIMGCNVRKRLRGGYDVYIPK